MIWYLPSIDKINIVFFFSFLESSYKGKFFYVLQDYSVAGGPEVLFYE
jgi:hypothetical protein